MEQKLKLAKKYSIILNDPDLTMGLATDKKKM